MPGRTRLRRIIGVVGVAVVAGGALAVIGGTSVLQSANLANPGLTAASGSSAATLATPAIPVAAAAAVASAELESPSTTAASAEGAAPTGSPSPAWVPESGPGLTRPGILLIAWPVADGSFEVVERVRLAGLTTVVTLRPAPVDRVGHQFASSSGTASQVQLSAGDRSVVVPRATVDSPVDLVVAAADRFELRYRLVDVTIRSTPSTDGRALAVIGPLTAGVGSDVPVRLVVLGDAVLGLNCPLLPISAQSCGSRLAASPGFERELPSELALAAVQIDLPMA